MGLRTGSSTAEGGTRARPLRGKVLARPSPSRADDNDCLRLPPTSPPHKSGAGKKESTVRRLNPRCQPSATPSSISSFDQALDGVRTAKSGSARKSGVSKSAKVVLASEQWEAGVLATYGPNVPTLYRRAARHLDRLGRVILK